MQHGRPGRPGPRAAGLGLVGRPVPDEQVRAVGDGRVADDGGHGCSVRDRRLAIDAARRYHARDGCRGRLGRARGSRVRAPLRVLRPEHRGRPRRRRGARHRHPQHVRPGPRDPGPPARADPVPGHGRRGHARSLRPRLRQRALPARHDLGPRALRDVHGADRRAAQARDRPRGAGPRRRTRRGRHRSARPDVRRDARPSRSAGVRSSSRYVGRGHTDHDIVITVPGADVLFAGDLVEQGNVPFFGDGYPLDWVATRPRPSPSG